MKYTNLFAFILILSMISIKAQNKNVGIGTDDPKATLDIRGNLKVTNPDEYDPQHDLIRLYRKKGGNPGEHEIVAVGDANTKQELLLRPFYTFKMAIKTNGTSPNIEDYDTKIPTDKYSLILTNSVLDQYQDPYHNPAVFTHIEGKGSSYQDGNPIKQVKLFEKDGTWHLFAKYPDVKAVGEVKDAFEWVVTVLVSDKYYTQDINPNPTSGHFDLGNDAKGSASQDPLLRK